jgi:perosamine synthetase
MATLRERGVESRTFFCPMNLQPFLREQAGFRDVPCPVAEELWQRGLYLPSSPSLSDEDVEGVAALVAELSAVRS